MSDVRTDRPLRILQVVGGMNRGGTETWLMHVLRNIDRDRYHLHFLVHSDEPGAYDEEITALGARVIRCQSPARPWQYASNFNRVLREYGPYDIVHSHVHHFSGFVLWLAKRAGIRGRIAHSHADTVTDERQASLLRRGYLYTMKRLISRYGTEGLTASERAAASLFSPNHVGDPQWSVLYCAVDLAPFEMPIDAPALRRELAVPENAFVVGHVGRFVEVKNHAFLIDIAAELVTLEPRSFFVLVGDGPLRAQVEKLVAQRNLSDRILFTGLRPDVPSLMRGVMDVFVFPSFYEGLGLVLIEAQAAGLPCVCSDTITSEACVVEGLVRQLSLSSPARDWARAIYVSQQGVRSEGEARMHVQASPFNIAVGLEALTRTYDRYSSPGGAATVAAIGQD